MFASFHRHTATVEVLVEAGAYTEAKNKVRKTERDSNCRSSERVYWRKRRHHVALKQCWLNYPLVRTVHVYHSWFQLFPSIYVVRRSFKRCQKKKRNIICFGKKLQTHAFDGIGMLCTLSHSQSESCRMRTLRLIVSGSQSSCFKVASDVWFKL